MKTFVLVHGAWHGGWCWRKVRPLLAGHAVYTPSLTGLGDRAHLLDSRIGIETHIEDIVRLIEAEELDGVVLAGHGYAGAVITGVADRIAERIAALVYIDAALPAHGQSLLELQPRERREAFLAAAHDGGEGWRLPLAVAADPVARRAELDAVWAHFGVADAADIAWLERHCVDHPFRTFTDRMHLAGHWLKVPRKHYLLAQGYAGSAHHAIHARLTGQPGWDTIALPSGHEMMVTHPQELAAILLRA